VIHIHTAVFQKMLQGKTKISLNKSVEIQGWLSKAHLYCLPAFRRAGNRILNLTLLNLVFHNYGAILNNVSCFNVTISNGSFLNCKTAVGMGQRPSAVCQQSSLVINSTEFLYNNYSVAAHLYNEIFFLKISRCIFEGTVGRFNVTSEDRKMRGNVYIFSEKRVHVHGIRADSIFRELRHEYNGFALSIRTHGLFTIGNLSILNTTFLRNENAVFVFGVI